MMDTIMLGQLGGAAIVMVVCFQAIQSALSKGVLRGGGDTKFPMVADVLFQWCASIPLGILAGPVWDLDPFWVLIALRIDYFIKSVWLIFRLKNGRWIHKAKKMEESVYPSPGRLFLSALCNLPLIFYSITGRFFSFL